MRSEVYQGGLIVQVTTEEVKKIVPYIKYSDYIWTKLWKYVLPPRVQFVSATNVLRILDTLLREGLGIKYTTTAGLAPTRFKNQIGSTVNVSTGVITLALSGEVVRVFNLFPVIDPEFQKLRDRLKGTVFPDPRVFYRFLKNLCSQELSDPREDLPTATNWSKVFPSIFTEIDLTAWKTQRKEIFTIFAQNRRTSVGLLQKFLEIK